jgi:hypothetical protein
MEPNKRLVAVSVDIEKLRDMTRQMRAEILGPIAKKPKRDWSQHIRKLRNQPLDLAAHYERERATASPAGIQSGDVIPDNP